MGKCKKRLIARSKTDKNPIFITRNEAVESVIDLLTENPSSIEARNTITLFGLTAEELSEAGVSYEILRSMDAFLL